MCMTRIARFGCRSLRRLGRRRTDRPDDAGIGAQLMSVANAASL